MPWLDAASYAWLLAAINADIMREMAAADACLRGQLQDPEIRRRLAVFAAAALANATALAAELIALGGHPPVASLAGDFSFRIGEPGAWFADARTALAHYQDRMAMARRLGLVRLQEVFREIARSKKKYLAQEYAAPPGREDRSGEA